MFPHLLRLLNPKSSAWSTQLGCLVPTGVQAMAGAVAGDHRRKQDQCGRSGQGSWLALVGPLSFHSCSWQGPGRGEFPPAMGPALQAVIRDILMPGCLIFFL